MAATVNFINESERLRKKSRQLPDACRQMLDAFVSGRTQHAVSAAEQPRARRLESPNGGRPSSDQVGAPAVHFGPMDPNVVSDSIPAFFIGRNRDGFWVAREAKGRIGGLFVLKRSAVAFAHKQAGSAGCATIFPAERFELDLQNKGNPLASFLLWLLTSLRPSDAAA